ncbi:MAG: AraC family transcriptional regulator [Treponema sp.]|jgi:AraC-like DNA-binding protein|nr:AraC family transcriptional regulator [Treponema sp.]
MEPEEEIVYPSPGYSFCFQISRDRKLHYNWHLHNEYEFAVCQRGEGEIRVGDTILSFKGPAAYFIASRIPHALISSGPFDGWIIQLPLNILNAYEKRPEFAFITDLTGRSFPALSFSSAISLRIIAKLEKAQERSGVFRWISLLEALYAASIERNVFRCSFLSEKSLEENTDRFDEICHAIFKESAQPHSLADSARAAGMSVQSFCRNFKKKTGMTFVEYIHSVRINNAKKLLQQTRMYVDDICYECGFNTVSFFNRKFREQTGMTPIQYRQNYGADYH